MSASRDPLTTQLRGVLERLEERVAERVEEDRLDQGLGRLAARAVRHRDAFFPDPRAAAPGAVDAVQDLLLPVGQRQLAPVAGSGRVQVRVRSCSRSASSIQLGWPWTSWPTRPEVMIGRLGDPVAVHPAEVVVGGAGALRGHHAGPDRGLRGARGAEHLAFPRLEHALEHLTALAGLRVGHPHPGHLEQQFRVHGRVLLAHLERRVRDEAEAAPLEVGPQLHRLADGLQGRPGCRPTAPRASTGSPPRTGPATAAP